MALPALAMAALGLAWGFGWIGSTVPGNIADPPSESTSSQEGPFSRRIAHRNNLLHAPGFDGRIVDERGHPHPGVEVQLCGTQLPPEVLTSTRSSATGRFVLRPDRSACSHRYRVRARVQVGFPWVLGPILDPERREILRLADLAVPRPAAIQGRILDPDDQPLAGMRLAFIEARSRGILGDEAPGREVRSGPEGGFRLLLPPNTPYRIRILISQRYRLPAQPAASFRPGANPLTLRAQALPDSDLKLRFWTWNRRPHPGVRHRVLADPEEGYARLEARADQPLPSILLRMRIKIPKSGRVDVFMPEGGRLSLQPHPLLPATQVVRVRFQYLGSKTRSGREPQGPLASNPEGSFEAKLQQGQVLLQELLPGRWRFWIQARGLPESHPIEVLLRKGGVRPVRSVLLVGSARIAGRLLDDRAQPVASALLRIYAGPSKPDQKRAPNQGWIAQIRTDAHGRFEFVGLPLGSYQLWLRQPGGRESRLAEGRLFSGPNQPLDLVLPE